MAKRRKKRAKMRAGTCKCVRTRGGRRKLCKLKSGRVRFKGKC